MTHRFFVKTKTIHLVLRTLQTFLPLVNRPFKSCLSIMFINAWKRLFVYHVYKCLKTHLNMRFREKTKQTKQQQQQQNNSFTHSNLDLPMGKMRGRGKTKTHLNMRFPWKNKQTHLPIVFLDLPVENMRCRRKILAIAIKNYHWKTIQCYKIHITQNLLSNKPLNSCKWFHVFLSFKSLLQICNGIIWAGPWENVSYVICDQQRRRSACASAQSDQRLRCSLLK